MVHRPEITEYVQRLKEYRQRQNRKYKQRREGVLYRKQKNRKTNTIQNTGSKFFFFFFFFLNFFFPLFLFSPFSFFLFILSKRPQINLFN